jgi:hypothetical protein
MATQSPTAVQPEQDQKVEQKIGQLRERFADAPEVGRTALERVLQELTAQATQTPPPPVKSAGRAGSRLGQISELTILVPLAPGGADGEWDAYIDDFVAKIPDYLDIISSAFQDWPGIRSPGAKDYFLKYQVTAEGWYVANPNLTVVEARRLERVGRAVDEFLDNIGG